MYKNYSNLHLNATLSLKNGFYFEGALLPFKSRANCFQENFTRKEGIILNNSPLNWLVLESSGNLAPGPCHLPIKVFFSNIKVPLALHCLIQIRIMTLPTACRGTAQGEGVMETSTI